MTDVWEWVATRLEEEKTCCMTTLTAGAQAGQNVGDRALFGPEGFLAGETWMEQNDELARRVAQAIKTLQTGSTTLGDGSRIFLDVLLAKPRLLICGAGHIAVPLARLCLELGFAVTVLDDRADFVRADRFPGCELLCEDFTAALSTLKLPGDAFVVVITRGHEHDVECLRQLLVKPTRYVGMIGSKRRVKFVREMLQREEFEPQRLGELFSPIGLPIGAESPAEIALSLAAELVGVRRKGAQHTRNLRETGTSEETS